MARYQTAIEQRDAAAKDAQSDTDKNSNVSCAFPRNKSNSGVLGSKGDQVAVQTCMIN